MSRKSHKAKYHARRAAVIRETMAGLRQIHPTEQSNHAPRARYIELGMMGAVRHSMMFGKTRDES